MNILSAAQIRHLDAFTIQHEPITSAALMERAAGVFFNKLLSWLPENAEVTVFCGSGNNGGDGCVIARLLMEHLIPVRTVFVPFGTVSNDCQLQYEQIKQHIHVFSEYSDWEWNEQSVIVDALLGIGSNREPEGVLAEAIRCINAAKVPVISVDMPSGLPADELLSHDCVVSAHFTWTFQAPKLTFFLPETAEYAGDWDVLDIGLSREETTRLHVTYQHLTPEIVNELLPVRKRFSHKGTYGHGLLVAGSDGKMGAAVLSSRAALRSGIGLLSVYTISAGRTILPVAVPEAMGIFDESSDLIMGKQLPELASYSALGLGPGLGVHDGTGTVIRAMIAAGKPVVFDADALNYLSLNSELLNKLPENSVLTPHPKEFERLVGKSTNSLERLQLLKALASTTKSVVVLKDAITTIALPGGTCWFNTAGNPGMATGGAGDVLTGIILGLLAQGFSAEDAAKIAVFHHGLSGDKAVSFRGVKALIASDLVDFLAIEKVED